MSKKPAPKKFNWKTCPPPTNPITNAKYIDYCVDYITKGFKPLTTIAEEKRTFDDLDKIYFDEMGEHSHHDSGEAASTVLNHSYFNSLCPTENVSVRCACCENILESTNVNIKSIYHHSTAIPWTTICQKCLE